MELNTKEAVKERIAIETRIKANQDNFDYNRDKFTSKSDTKEVSDKIPSIVVSKDNTEILKEVADLNKEIKDLEESIRKEEEALRKDEEALRRDENDLD
jgi:hypothetical protein